MTRPRSCSVSDGEGGREPQHAAKKSLGQHFLVDPNLQRKIVEALEARPEDEVLEIGAGTGALTRHLVGRVRRLRLIELDDELAAALANELGGREDVEVIHADILELPPQRLASGEDLKIIGNIPYGITSPLIFHLLEIHPRPERIVLTVQKEVAERLAAEPGSKRYGALTVGVQAVASVEILFDVSRNAFRPRPDVASAAIRIVPASPAPLTSKDESDLRRLTRAAFSRRRKQLQKALRQAAEYGLDAAEARTLLESLEIDPATRPDALAVADYVRLAARLEARR